MSISGRKFVLGFYGMMGALALIGLGIVVFLRSRPVVQVEQRNLARVLSNAYQKYRYDANDWPTNAYDAAASFATERQDFPEKIRKAESDWGLKASMVDENSDTPKLKVTYAKPSPYEMTFMLRTKRPGR